MIPHYDTTQESPELTSPCQQSFHYLKYEQKTKNQQRGKKKLAEKQKSKQTEKTT